MPREQRQTQTPCYMSPFVGIVRDRQIHREGSYWLPGTGRVGNGVDCYRLQWKGSGLSGPVVMIVQSYEYTKTTESTHLTWGILCYVNYISLIIFLSAYSQVPPCRDSEAVNLDMAWVLRHT